MAATLKTSRALVLCFIIFALPLLATAQDEFGSTQHVVVTDSMKIPAELSQNEAKTKLLKLARKQAVENVTGVTVNVANVSMASESGNDVFESYQQLVRNSVKGRIVQEEEPRFSLKDRKFLHVRYEATVAEETEKPDPYFNAEMDINESAFTVGEKLKLTVEASKDAYITIFSITENGKASVLFPNAYMADNKISANTERQIPNAEEQQKLSFTLQPKPDEPDSKYSEMLLCIATKNKVSYDKLQTDLKYKSDWIELNRWLMSFPRDQWTEAYAQYQVFPK